MWELLETLSTKAADADDAGEAIAARAGASRLNSVELVQNAMSTLAPAKTPTYAATAR